MRRPAPTTTAVGQVIVSTTVTHVGAALATTLFVRLTPAGTAWLRLTCAAIALLIIVRPTPWTMPRRDLALFALLGADNALMMTAFFAAIHRLPLGTAAALGFLGPLAIAIRKAHNWQALAWPVLALAGVVALTRPFTGRVDMLGVAFALTDATCWALYILLTQRMGARTSGGTGLALAMTVAALITTVTSAHLAIGHLTLGVVATGAGIALLTPVMAFWMELSALRVLPAGTFGTLMCLEPAIALIVGLVVLRQHPSPAQVLGVALVVAAALGAERAASSDLTAVAATSV